MKPVQIKAAVFSPRERWLEFSRALNRAGAVTTSVVASATIELTSVFSIFAGRDDDSILTLSARFNARLNSLHRYAMIYEQALKNM